MESTTYAQPVKTIKVNIGKEEDPMFAQIWDYWDEEIIENRVDLLHEYQDIFSMAF